MKLRYAFIAVGFLCALFAKNATETLYRANKTVPPNLKPVEAGYEGKSLKRYSFGFDSFLASLLWVEVLQLAEHTPLKGDEVSWEYAQIDAITTLDPKFADAFKFGSIFLSTFRRDKLGGLKLLEKWALRDRTYWRPVYMTGMHYFQEIGDYEAAAPYILRASAMKDAPDWVSSLGVRLLSETGTLMNAISSAIEMSRFSANTTNLYFLKERVRSLVFNIQKKDWSDAVAEFRKRNKREPASLDEVASLNLRKSRELSSLSTFKDESIPELVQSELAEKYAFRYDGKTKSVVSVDPELEKQLGKTGVYVQKADAPRIK